MLVASRFYRKHISCLRRPVLASLASTSRKTRIRPTIGKEHTSRNTPGLPPPDIVISETIRRIKGYLKFELQLERMERFLHRCLDRALQSTSSHQQVYEAVIVYLIQNMWAQPAACVYDRMTTTGFIPSDDVDARMLVILLADAQDSADVILARLSAIVSNQNFTDQHLVEVLNVAEDYNIPPKCVVALVQDFMRGKGAKYIPRCGMIAASLRAAVKLGDVELMREVLDRGDESLKLSAMTEAWKVADRMDDCVRKLGLRLVGALGNPATQEDEFLRSLEIMNDVGMNKQIVARACASFLANRDANYLPNARVVREAIEAFIKVDKIDDAFALLHRVGIQPSEQPLYRSFLANLRDSRPLDHHSFAKLLSAIDAAGISLDTTLLNIIISREVRLKRAVNAFSLFNDMKRSPHLPPDAHTYGSLFTAYRRIRPRSFLAAKKRDTSGHPLRNLFRELVQNSKRHENSIRPNTSLLNTALKAFLRQRDYAGAIVVIKSFDLFQIPLDNRSYYSVVKLLVRRVWAEVQGDRPKHQERWADRFLGVRHYTDIVLNRSLVNEVFAHLRRKYFDVSLPLYIGRGRLRLRPRRYFRHLRPDEETYYPFPTMEMMESLVLPEPVDFVYHPLPLIRLLSRALYAEVVMNREQGSRIIDELTKKAEDEMISEHLF